MTADNLYGIGPGYMAAYAEIPTTRVQDPAIAAKKLCGHTRQFQPGDIVSEVAWATTNEPALRLAYGDEMVDRYFSRLREPGEESARGISRQISVYNPSTLETEIVDVI